MRRSSAGSCVRRAKAGDGTARGKVRHFGIQGFVSGPVLMCFMVVRYALVPRVSVQLNLVEPC